MGAAVIWAFSKFKQPQTLGSDTASASEKLVGYVQGTWMSAMIYLGDRMGLYERLKQAGALTSVELADIAGLSERWVREWLCGQAAAGVLQFDESTSRFSILDAFAAILADPGGREDNILGFFAVFPGKNTMLSLSISSSLSHPRGLLFVSACMLFLTGIFSNLPDLPTCFKTGVGMSYDHHGGHIAESMERLHQGFSKYDLIPYVLPALCDGKLLSKLERGATVADVGCGSAFSLCILAKRFPKSHFHGYELSAEALELAAKNIALHGVGANVTMHDCSKETLSGKPVGGRGTKRVASNIAPSPGKHP